jgi:hypothetical protein
MILRIPAALKIEHENLYNDLKLATGESGETGTIAGEVAKYIYPHFVKEEELALPPLGALVALSEGALSEDMKGVIAVTDRFRKEYPKMLEEHKHILEALKRLSLVARQEKNYEVAHFVVRPFCYSQFYCELYKRQ